MAMTIQEKNLKFAQRNTLGERIKKHRSTIGYITLAGFLLAAGAVTLVAFLAPAIITAVAGFSFFGFVLSAVLPAFLVQALIIGAVAGILVAGFSAAVGTIVFTLFDWHASKQPVNIRIAEFDRDDKEEAFEMAQTIHAQAQEATNDAREKNQLTPYVDAVMGAEFREKLTKKRMEEAKVDFEKAEDRFRKVKNCEVDQPLSRTRLNTSGRNLVDQGMWAPAVDPVFSAKTPSHFVSSPSG